MNKDKYPVKLSELIPELNSLLRALKGLREKWPLYKFSENDIDFLEKCDLVDLEHSI